jgi:hypothetical protein
MSVNSKDVLEIPTDHVLIPHQTMNARLQLLFHADHFKFALVKELDDWRQEFNKLREALLFAKKEGATELPFLVLDEGELYSESIIGVDPVKQSLRISTPARLASVIAPTIKARGLCRVFPDVLKRCWSDPFARKGQDIIEFAKAHGWAVEIHEPGMYGTVADFTKRVGS